MKAGALAGTYAGVTAGATLGAGLAANALVGGLDRSIALNPLSLESNTGANITLGVAKLTLEASK
jgi:di/tricarboxylate transporter